MISLLFLLGTLTAPDSAETVPLRILYGSRAAVEVTINGRGPYLFAIETGAPVVMISARLAEELKLPVDAGAPTVHAHDGPISMRRIDSLRIGSTVMRDLAVAPAPQIIEGVDGLLGLPAYQDLLLTIDYPARTVRFDRGTLAAPNGRDIFATVPIGPFLGVEIAIAGRKLPAVLDTQSAGAIDLLPAMAAGLPWAAPPAASGMAAVGSSAPVVITSARLAGDVTLGAYTIQRPIIGAHPMPAGYPKEAVLGSRFLMNFAMTIDQRSGRVRLVRADRTVPPPAPMYSIGLRTSRAVNGPPTAQIVTESGTAYRAGIREGDEIVSIDGRPAADFSWPETLTLLVQTGRTLKIEIRRDGRSVMIEVAPEVVVK